jgi:hypothetical protein
MSDTDWARSCRGLIGGGGGAARGGEAPRLAGNENGGREPALTVLSARDLS